MIASAWDKEWGNPFFQESIQQLKMLHFLINFILQKDNNPKFHKIVMFTKKSYFRLKWIKEPKEKKCFSN